MLEVVFEMMGGGGKKKKKCSLVPHRIGMIHSPPLLLLRLRICIAQELCHARFAACKHDMNSPQQTASD